MRKVSVVLVIILLFGMLYGCSSKGTSGSNSNKYSGEITEFSKQYLSKGYCVNIYRYSSPFSSDSYGKDYIEMSFGILADYTTMLSFDENADYNIKKIIVSNVKVLSTSKMGEIKELAILDRYSSSLYDPHMTVSEDKDFNEIINEVPNTDDGQVSVMVELGKIALYDVSKSEVAANGGQPSLEAIYNELGITRDQVALKIGFRIELITVSNKTVYMDYEIDVPPIESNITSDEFHYDFYKTDYTQMKPFFEKK